MDMIRLTNGQWWLAFAGAVLCSGGFAIAGLVVGALIGGNLFSGFEYAGQRGYEAAGLLGLHLGAVLGFVAGACGLVLVLSRHNAVARAQSFGD